MRDELALFFRHGIAPVRKNTVLKLEDNSQASNVGQTHSFQKDIQTKDGETSAKTTKFYIMDLFFSKPSLKEISENQWVIQSKKDRRETKKRKTCSWRLVTVVLSFSSEVSFLHAD